MLVLRGVVDDRDVLALGVAELARVRPGQRLVIRVMVPGPTGGGAVRVGQATLLPDFGLGIRLEIAHLAHVRELLVREVVPPAAGKITEVFTGPAVRVVRLSFVPVRELHRRAVTPGPQALFLVIAQPNPDTGSVGVARDLEILLQGVDGGQVTAGDLLALATRGRPV